MQLVSKLRVDAARRLISDSELSLDYIALEVGLADASHLAHIFRRFSWLP